jgi:tetratricopeptide (TPR) repeat protein
MMIILTAVWLSGCLPEYPIESIQFSPDGRYLAYFASNLGMKVADLEASRDFILLSGNINGTAFAWAPDSRQIAYCSDAGGSWDIWTIGLERNRRRLTSHPSKDFQPQWSSDGDGVYFVSYRNGDADICFYDIPTSAVRCIIARPEDQLAPRVSPNGQLISYLSYENARPELFLFDTRTSQTRLVQSFADVGAGIDADSLAWSADSRKFVYVAREGSANSLNIFDVEHARSHKILDSKHSITSPLLSPDGKYVFYIIKGNITKRRLGVGFAHSLDFDGFEQETAAIHPEGKYLCFSVNRSFIGICRPDFSGKKFLSFRLEDEILLGHLYALQGRKTKALKIYDDLIESLKVDEQLATVKFHYALELLKLGETARATDLLEELAESTVSEPERKKVLSALGYAYLSQGKREKSRATFEKYAVLLAEEDRSVPPALGILRSENEDLINRFAKASRFISSGDYHAGAKEFHNLLRRFPDDPSLQAEYLSAISEIDQTASLLESLRPELQIEYREISTQMLEDFVATAPSSAKLEELLNDLFWRYVELKEYKKARRLIIDTPGSSNETALVSSLSEMLTYYLGPGGASLEIIDSVNEIALHPETTKHLLKLKSEQKMKLLIRLALAKGYYLERDAAQAEAEITQATQTLAETQAILIPRERNKYEFILTLLEAKCLELKGLFSDAVAKYEEADTMLRSLAKDFPKTVWELRFQKEFLSHNLEDPKLVKRINLLRFSVGDGLITPHGEKKHMLAALKGFDRLIRKNADPEKATQIKYFSACCYNELNDNSMVSLLFREILRNPELPDYLRKKALLELAILYERIDEAFLAKRHYSSLLGMDLDEAEMLLIQAQH